MGRAPRASTYARTAAAAADAADSLAQQENTQAELKALQAKVSDLVDQAMRAQAEAQNARRRADEEVAKVRKFAVEAFAAAIWPNSSHAVVAISDPRKGEALVLVTDSGTASVEAFISYGHLHGLSEISIPRKIVKTYALPVLGTGKMDLPAIEIMARS